MAEMYREACGTQLKCV